MKSKAYDEGCLYKSPLVTTYHHPYIELIVTNVNSL